MRYFTSIIVTLTLLSSCTTLYFSEPQPAKGERLFTIPAELQGNWTTEDGYLTIHDQGSITHTIQIDSLGNIDTVRTEKINLSDSIQLFKSGRFYVFNELNPNGHWNIEIVKMKCNKSHEWYILYNPPFLSSKGGLQLDSVQLNYEYLDPDSDFYKSADTTVYSLDLPENLEEATIDAIYYSGKMKRRTMKKALIEDNLIMTLLPNGTILKAEEPEEHDLLLE